MREIWKDLYFRDKGVIYDYRGLYQVSNFGLIKSLPRNGTVKNERILIPRKDKDGYLLINLSKNNKVKTFKVHRIVGNVFLDNPDNLPEINHDDGNKENCCVDNLYWTTRSGNMKHAYKTGLRVVTEKQRKHTRTKIIE